MLRVVLDTNQFVSSLLVKHGRPAEVLDAWKQQRYVLLISPDIIKELQSTLSYPRIRRKYHITDNNVKRLTDLLHRDAIVLDVDSAAVAGAIPADRSDEIFLACALTGRADVIVSGDRHLLDLGSYRGMPILTAREFMDLLNKS